MSLSHATFDTSLGRMLAVVKPTGLAGLYFSDHKHPPRPETIGEDIGHEPAHSLIGSVSRQLREYLGGERENFDIPLSLSGDDFSQRVWEILRGLSFGETTTYGTIASRLGNLAYAQRVGQAVGHNPIMIVVPCHRVLGADGSLTGYAGGLERKRTLLALEEPPAELSDRLF